MQNFYSGHLVFLRFHLLLSMAGRAPTPTAGATCTWMNWRLPDESLVKISFERNPFTPLKTNMSPGNQWLEDVFPNYWNSPFLGDMLVFRGVSTLDIQKYLLRCFQVCFSALKIISQEVSGCVGVPTFCSYYCYCCYYYFCNGPGFFQNVLCVHQKFNGTLPTDP